MKKPSHYIAPTLLAAALGLGAAVPAPAHAQSQDDLVRILVNVADVVMRGGQPYYRHGNYGYDDRLVRAHDPYGRVVYYRLVPRNQDVAMRDVDCNKRGKCKVTYYDPRYDRSRYDRHDRYDDRRHRWKRDRDDDDDDDDWDDDDD